MKAEHSKLMDKVLQSLDWNSILEVYKVFKMGVGGGNEVIPGLKRKPFSEDLDKNDIKNELKSLIKHVIKNHIPQLSYGHWIIYWVSDEWELDSEFDDEIDFTAPIENIFEEPVYTTRIRTRRPVIPEVTLIDTFSPLTTIDNKHSRILKVASQISTTYHKYRSIC